MVIRCSTGNFLARFVGGGAEGLRAPLARRRRALAPLAGGKAKFAMKCAAKSGRRRKSHRQRDFAYRHAGHPLQQRGCSLQPQTPQKKRLGRGGVARLEPPHQIPRRIMCGVGEVGQAEWCRQIAHHPVDGALKAQTGRGHGESCNQVMRAILPRRPLPLQSWLTSRVPRGTASAFDSARCGRRRLFFFGRPCPEHTIRHELAHARAERAAQRLPCVFLRITYARADLGTAGQAPAMAAAKVTPEP